MGTSLEQKMVNYIFFESASGFGLFERTESEDIGKLTEEVQNSVLEMKRFGKIMRLASFLPFTSAENALLCQNEISEGVLPEIALNFLSTSLPKVKAGKKAKFVLGVSDPKIGNAISESLSIPCECNDLNTFAMRVREWYSWHFPELVKIVNDNVMLAKLAIAIRNKTELNDDSLEMLEELTQDETKANQILDASRASMGQDISELDMINIVNFAGRVVELHQYRADLHEYLKTKMIRVAPNLSTLIGEMVGARLISHAGSLTNLSKYPASTVQILGAEKALFRALKTKGNTPKYGLIFHSSFIGRASQKNKGRISRYLANKASIASRIDSFSDEPTTLYGQKLREQVEERLEFYNSGKAPKKNIDVMQAVKAELAEEQGGDAAEEKVSKKKRKKEDSDEEEEEVVEKKQKKEKKKDKSEKKKKKKKADSDSD